jgi:glucose dehydrogenase
MNAKSLSTSTLWLTTCSAVALFAGALAQPAWAQAPTNSEVQASDLVSSPGSKAVPSSTKVTVTNEMMSSAATSQRDWVLHGKDYNNQRYSPLSQINDSTINSLMPAAFNAKTGEKVWRYNLGAGVNAPPISYEVDGRQYIAVAAGGNSQLNYPRGDAIAIFALPESTTPKHASAWDSWRDFLGLNKIENTSKQASR